MTEIRWRSASRSDPGRVRESNEDSVFENEAFGVFVVADGMGGHAAGEVASAIASRTIGDSACQTCPSLAELGEQLTDAFLAASDEIARAVEEDPERMGMGTTATVLTLRKDGHWIVAHIGDSRAYLWRNGSLERLTRDHSWVQEQVDRGILTPEQAIGHPQSNIITRALGTDPRPAPDLYFGECASGDVFLLATDGLTDMLREDEIAGILRAHGGREAAADALVGTANDAGGHDNITLLLVEIAGQ